MTTSSEKCSTRWCDEATGHDGNHVSFVGEIVPICWPYSMLGVTVEAGPGEPDNPTLILTSTAQDGRWVVVRMGVEQAAVIAAMLGKVAGRFA